MKRISIVILYIILSFYFLTFCTYSQLRNVKLEHISGQLELSQNTVTSIFQDKKGFMWFGTQDGLNRFDGYSMKEYRHDANDLNSFAGGIIRCIVGDKTGNLCVGSDQGLSEYEWNKNKWTNYKYDPSDNGSIDNNIVYSVYEDSEGILWVGTRSGLNKYDKREGKFIHYLNYFDNSGNPVANYFNAICEDKNNCLWIASNELGLFKFEKKTGKFTKYQFESKKANSLSSNSISSMCVDKDDNLWIFTLEGLDKYIIKENKFIHFKVKNRSKEEQRLSQFSQIMVDKEGNVLIGASGGLKIFDRTQNKIEPVLMEKISDIEIIKNPIFSIYEDNTGIIWIGTSMGGIYKYDIQKNKFSNIKNTFIIDKKQCQPTIWGIMAVEKNILWIPTENYGLLKYETKTNKYTNYNFEYKNKEINGFLIINRDRANDLLIASDAVGLCKLKTKDMNISVYGHNPGNPFSISSNIISDIMEDKSGYIWIGTRTGLNKFDPEKKIFKRFKLDSLKLNLEELNNIMRICEDENNNLWLGTRYGLSKFNKETEKYSCYVNDPKNRNSIVAGVVNSLYYDGKGVLWIGTNNGLDKFEISKEKFTHFTDKEGLPNNNICGILNDDSGNLWISTNKGLSRFNLKTGLFFNFNESDGLPSNEFNQFSYCKSPDGEMYFGGINGITHFYPDKILSNSIKPPVVITAFRKFDKLFNFDKDISEVKEIELNYDENFFSFEFAALNYSNTEKNQYAYKMEGFDKDWINCGKRRSASYTNLDPGEYIFRVKGSNNDGLWNEEGASIKVIIKPPFWMTWWFRASGVFLFVCLGFVAYNTRVRSMKNRAIYLENQVDERTKQLSERNRLIEQQNEELIVLKKDLEIKAEQADSANRSKSEFLANMSHEIRTPMNAILGFAEILSNKIKNLELKNYTNIILSSGNALLTIINDILDLSKIEAGKLVLQPALIDLGRMMEEIQQLFTPKVKEKGLDFILEVVKDFPKGIYLDEVRIRQIIMNLIGNAIKFTEKGYVKITANAKPSLNENDKADITITVEDTGIGIPNEQIEKIFKPFEQVDGQSTRKFGGTGLGLSISTKLIAMMGGSINATSEKGSIFTITLPGIVSVNEIDQSLQDQNTAELDIEFDTAKILVVDDIATNRELVKAYLEGYNLEIKETENGEQTLEETKKNKYDLVLLDRKMPGMSGEDVAKIMKQDEATKNIPIIIFTASALKEEEERLSKIVDSYLTKPVNKLKLIQELKKYLPYKKKKKIAESELSIEGAVPETILTQEQKEKLIGILENEHYKEWESVSKTRAMGSVKTFSINLQKTAEEFGSTTLKKYSNELLESVNLFKVAKVKTAINDFPKIIEKIKL